MNFTAYNAHSPMACDQVLAGIKAEAAAVAEVHAC